MQSWEQTLFFQVADQQRLSAVPRWLFGHHSVLCTWGPSRGFRRFCRFPLPDSHPHVQLSDPLTTPPRASVGPLLLRTSLAGPPVSFPITFGGRLGFVGISHTCEVWLPLEASSHSGPLDVREHSGGARLRTIPFPWLGSTHPAGGGGPALARAPRLCLGALPSGPQQPWPPPRIWFHSLSLPSVAEVLQRGAILLPRGRVALSADISISCHEWGGECHRHRVGGGWAAATHPALCTRPPRQRAISPKCPWG